MISQNMNNKYLITKDVYIFDIVQCCAHDN